MWRTELKEKEQKQKYKIKNDGKIEGTSEQITERKNKKIRE